MDLEIVNDGERGLIARDRETGEEVPVPIDELDVQNTYSESVDAGLVNTDRSITKSEPVANVTAHGAVGDGSTNDTQSFKDAVEAAGKGGVVYVPSTTDSYLVDPEINVKDAQKIIGDGGDSTIKMRGQDLDALPDAFGLFQVYGESGDRYQGVLFKNLHIDMNRQGMTGSTTVDMEGIDFKETNQSVVRECIIKNTISEGVDIDTGEYNKVVGNHFYECGGNGVHLSTDSNRNLAAQNTVEGCGHEQGRHGIDIFTGMSQYIIGNILYKNRIAIKSDGFGCVVSSNLIRDNDQHGIVVTNRPTLVAGNIAELNGSSAGHAGVNIQSSQNVVVGNSCTQNTDTGILLDGSGADRNLVVANSVGDYGGTITTDYGVREINSAEGNQIGWNDVSDSGTQGIDASAGSTVRHNNGYSTEASGSASVSDGDTISHELSETPSYVNVTASVDKHIAVATTVDGSSITIGLHDESDSAVTSDETVYWEARA